MREMKDSGIEWIGEIPKSWRTVEVKVYCKSVYAGGTPQSNNSEYWDGEIPWLPSGVCHDCKVYTASKYITKEGFENSSTKHIPANTALVAMTGATCGNTAFLTFNACANQSVAAYVAKDNTSSLFLWYLIQAAKEHLLTFQTGGAQGGVNVDNCKNIIVPYVPYEYQIRIADYLDKKCAKIDAIIEKQQEIIEKLKEYKLSIINEKTNVNTRVTCHLSYLGQMKNGLNFSNADDGEKIMFLGVGDFKDYFVLDNKTMFSTITVDEKVISEELMLESGDIIFVRSNGSKELVGRAVMVDAIDFKLTYTGFAIRYRNMRRDIINSKYLLYYFRSPDFRKLLEKNSQGSNISNMNQDLLGNIEINIPEMDYQNDKVCYLDEKCKVIDNTIEKKQETITKLLDYKKSLIYEVVTGKKEV